MIPRTAAIAATIGSLALAAGPVAAAASAATVKPHRATVSHVVKHLSTRFDNVGDGPDNYSTRGTGSTATGASSMGLKFASSSSTKSLKALPASLRHVDDSGSSSGFDN